MSAVAQPLFEPVELNSTPTAYYTASANTRVDQMTVSNPSSTAAHLVTINWVKGGGSADSISEIVPQRQMTAGESWNALPFVGHVLGAGDAIWASADGPLNFFASGTVIS